MLALYKHTERPTCLCSCRCCAAEDLHITQQPIRDPNCHQAKFISKNLLGLTNRGSQISPDPLTNQGCPRMQNLLKDAINRNKPEAKSRNLTQLSVATGCFSLRLLPYEEQGTNTQITTKSYRKNTYYIIIRAPL